MTDDEWRPSWAVMGRHRGTHPLDGELALQFQAMADAARQVGTSVALALDALATAGETLTAAQEEGP